MEIGSVFFVGAVAQNSVDGGYLNEEKAVDIFSGFGGSLLGKYSYTWYIVLQTDSVVN